LVAGNLMSNRKSRKRKAALVSPGRRVEEELGLDPAEWSVSVGFHKGILSGSRYTQVSVCHRPTGRERGAFFYAAGKAAARRDAVAIARRLVQELRRG
jgi:hypothetical protein